MTPRLACVVPILKSADADRSLRFYVDQLGFQVQWTHRFADDLPRFVSLARDEVRLFLTEHPETVAGSLVYFYVQQVDALAAEWQRAGATLQAGPVDQPWGVREIWLRDPDGNQLRCGEIVTSPGPR